MHSIDFECLRICVFAPTTTAATADTPIVTNGDAESGNVTGWNYTNTKYLSAQKNDGTAAVATAHKDGNIGGNYYFTSWSYTYLTQTVSLKSNTVYEISLDFYASASDKYITLTKSDATEPVFKKYIYGTGVWYEFAETFVLTEAGEYTLTIYTGTNDNFYFDNMAITALSAETENVVKGGDFEDRKDGNQNVYWNAATAKESTVVGYAATDGTNKIMNIGWGKTVSQVIPLKADTLYKLSYSEMCQPGNSGSITATVTAPDGTVLATNTTAAGSAFTTREILFYSADNVYATLNFKATDGNHYVDNISVVRSAPVLTYTQVTVEDSYMSFVYSAATDGTLTEAGALIAAGKNIPTGDLTVADAGDDPIVKKVVFSDVKSGAATELSVGITNTNLIDGDETIAVRPYVKYKDASGEHIVYGEQKSESLKKK